MSIPDNGNASSPITIAACGGNGLAASRVDLKILHNNVGDLNIILTSPTGNQHLLHERAGAGYNNIERSYTIDLSPDSVDGTWKLEAFDVSTGVSGKIDTWTLTLK